MAVTQLAGEAGPEDRRVCFPSPGPAAARSCSDQIPDATVTVTTVGAEKGLSLPDFT